MSSEELSPAATLSDERRRWGALPVEGNAKEPRVFVAPDFPGLITGCSGGVIDKFRVREEAVVFETISLFTTFGLAGTAARWRGSICSCNGHSF